MTSSIILDHLGTTEPDDWGGAALSAKPDTSLVLKALDIAHERLGKLQQVLFYSTLGSQVRHTHGPSPTTVLSNC